MLEGAGIPKNNPPYLSSIFPKISRQIISMSCCLLGYNNDHVVDEVVMGLLLAFSPRKKPTIFLNFNQFPLDVIHWKFLKFGTEKEFNISLCWFIYSCIISHKYFRCNCRSTTYRVINGQLFTGPNWLGKTLKSFILAILWINLFIFVFCKL